VPPVTGFDEDKICTPHGDENCHINNIVIVVTIKSAPLTGTKKG
jgi:hypothetical protein